MENIGLASRIIHTVATNTFFGGSFYVNIVETPARKSLKSASAVMDHFQASFPRAAFLMKRLAMVSSRVVKKLILKNSFNILMLKDERVQPFSLPKHLKD